VKKVEIEKPDDFLKLVESKKFEYLYHDHPSDGIDLFCDDEVEKLGYESVVFDCITYRQIAEFIENNCSGTLYYNDHPMGFNGFVIIDDIEDTRKKVKKYIIDTIKSEHYDLNELDSEQLEAFKFLGIN